MPDPAAMTDRTALARHRSRATRSGSPAMFLHEKAMQEFHERMALVNRTFTAPAVVAGFPDYWNTFLPEAKVVADADLLDMREAEHDLIVHAMALHWANDPVGQLVQARRALRPDGLFLAAMLGGNTLHELRATLSEAEIAVTGGLSPRVAPMGDIRDLGSLLQRAGFALPVADSIQLEVLYESALHLMHDLRAMGETNALENRNRRPFRRAILERTVELYQTRFASGERVRATFELIILTGWAPSPDQPKPLRPGSATARLADALKTEEHTLDDPAKPRRV